MMKYIVLLGDGMAGRPLRELNNRTTLACAAKPVMDRLAADSELGMACMVPEGMEPGSDTANLSVMGYDPKLYYTGRSPLEALSIGVNMAETDVSFRCNVVTVSDDGGSYEEQNMIDHSAGEISTEEARELIKTLSEELKREDYDFYSGVSYRHLLVQHHGRVVPLTPPHDILGRKIGGFLPESPMLRDMMVKSFDILRAHPVNKTRMSQGLRPANSAWFWGAGTKPSLTSFEKMTGKKGIMISAVDLLKGIALGAGMTAADIPGANGGINTNYRGKVDAALRALLEEDCDFAYIHVEAPDEMAHQGLAREKIKAIEYFDERVVAPMVQGMRDAGVDFRMLICPDHPTPVAVRTHTGEAVPYMIYDSTKRVAGRLSYCEETAASTGNVWQEGYRLLSHLLKEDLC